MRELAPNASITVGILRKREKISMRLWCGALLAGAAVLFVSQGNANDSSAALGASGVVLTQTADIRMAREDLYVSPHKIRIRYEFVNDSAKDIDTVVAFPLPDIDTRRFYVEPLGTVTDDPINFVGFSVVADGQRVTPNVEQRAFYKDKDVTAILASAQIPVNVVSGKDVQFMLHLSPTQVKILESADLGDHESGDGETPHWIIRTKFWWKQSFPAGKTVVLEHSYQPVTGQTFFIGQYVGTKPDEDGAAYFKNYCIDAGTRKAIASRIASKTGNPDDSGAMIAFATDYILMSGNNWKGPIGHFHLTLDKEKPDNILSLCWDGNLKKTKPTTFEESRENFGPTQDIKLLVLQNRPPGG
jgi:hypothetical protein